MINDLLGQLVEGLDHFHHLWQIQLEQFGSVEPTFSDDDWRKGFLLLVATLEKLDVNPACELSPNDPAVSYFINASKYQRSRGVSVPQSLIVLKGMWTAMEQLIVQSVAAESTKQQIILRLHRLAQTIETRLLNDWHHRGTDEALADLEQTNRQLARETATYENIFKATSNLVLITDQQGIITDANPEARVFYSGHPLLGEFCASLFDQTISDLNQFLSRFPPHQPHELTLQRDQYHQVFNLQILPIGHTSLTDQGWMLLLNDITCMVDHRQLLEQRVAERTQALTRSEKMLDAIFQSVGKGILLIDSDREIIKANQQASEMYGIPLEVLIGTAFCTLTDPDGCLTLMALSENLLEGQRRSAEVTSLYVNGTTFPSEITMTRMDLQGQRFWPVIIRDITEQRALENGLREEKLQSEEMNVTLRNVLKSIESDRREFEQNLTNRIRTELVPGLERIRRNLEDEMVDQYFDLLKAQLVALTTGFEHSLDAGLMKLSKSELKICRFIKAGLSSKEICEAMNLSFETIQTHRKNIRKKLDLRGKEINLHSYLTSRNCELGGSDD